MSRLRTASPLLAAASVVFVRWAGATGLSPRRLAVLLVVVPPICAAVPAYAVSRISEPAAAADVWLFAVCVVTFLAAMGLGVVSAHYAQLVHEDVRALRVRPVGRRQLVWATRVPALVLGVVAAETLLPAAVLLTERAAGYGWAHAGVTSALILLAGTALGWAWQLAVAKAMAGPALASLRLTAGLLGWLTFAFGGLALFGVSLQAGGEEFTPLLRVAPLVWPALLWLLLSAEPLAFAVCAAITVALWVLVAWLRPASVPAGVGEPVRVRLRVDRPALAARLTARRLWRNPRTREWLLMGVVACALTALAGWWVRTRLAMNVDDAVLLLLATQMALGVTPLVRGLSSRARPVEGRWGWRPSAHVGAAYLACLAVGCLLTSPVLAAALWSSPASAVDVLRALVVNVAIGLGVSFWLVPRLGSGGGEFVAFLAYFVACSAVQALPEVGGEGLQTLMALAIAGGLLLSCVLAERRNRAVIVSA